ncbi:MAG: hypothetical protein ABI605_17910 [Rhizobacter sp.]
MSKNPRGAAIEFASTAAITPSTWDEIWQLTQRFYDTERDHAQAQLKEHARTILFRSSEGNTQDGGELVGMASVDVYAATVEGRRVAVIYTSHVLLHEQYRGHNLIQKVGFHTFVETRLRHPLRPIYWFFDTFSYKSYLLLPRNFKHYWPRFDQATPQRERALMAHLATQTYGPAWSSEQGIVLRSNRKRLRPDTAPIDDRLAGNEALAFFARMNPGHAAGDMLVCLCPLTISNWLHAAVLAVRRLYKKRMGSARSTRPTP